MPKLLFIDDELQHWMPIIRKSFEKAGWVVASAADPEDGLKRLNDAEYDLVLLDLSFPGSVMQGRDVLKAVRKKHRGLPVIILTSSDSAADIQTAVKCVKAGAWDYFTKSNLDVAHLLLVADKATRSVDALRRRKRLVESFRRTTESQPALKFSTSKSKCMCTFAFRLSGLASEPVGGQNTDRLGLWIADQRLWQRKMISGLLARIPGRQVDLRYTPSQSGDQVDIALLGRVTAPAEEEAEALAEELWIDLESLLRINEASSAWRPIKSQADLQELLHPFDVHHVVEFRRRGPSVNVRQPIGFRETMRPDAPSSLVVPFALYSNEDRLPNLCQALVGCRQRVAVCVTMDCSSVELPDLDLITIDPKSELSEERHREAMRVRLAELCGRPHQLCQIRLTALSDGKVPSAVQKTIGAELISQDTSQWKTYELSDECARDLEQPLGLALPLPPRGEELTLVYTEAEAANVFGPPILLNDAVPGVQTLRPHETYVPTNLPATGSILGAKKIREGSVEVRIAESDKLKHVYVLGQTGTGKSTLLSSMILSDIREGRGLCLIDPHGELIESVMCKIPENRAGDVVLFDPSDIDHPIGLNLLECRTEADRDFLADELVLMLKKEFDPHSMGMVGPMAEQAIRAGARTVMDFPEGGTVVDIIRLFEDDKYLQHRMHSIREAGVKHFWKDVWLQKTPFHRSEILQHITSKLERFRQNTAMRLTVGQSKSSFDFRKVMDEGKILLVNLSKGGLGELNSAFLGMVLVTKLYNAATSRQDVKPADRLPYCLYMDEFQNFTTDTVRSMLGECRKYGLALVLAHQNQRQLSETTLEAVLGNVGTTIFFRPGVPDAERVALYLRPYFTDRDMLDLPNWMGVGRLLIDNAPTRPLVFQTVLEDSSGNAETEGRVRSLSRAQYASERELVEAEIVKRQSVPGFPSTACGGETK